MARKEIRPLNFYLNEQHELAREKESGRGGLPQYVGIDWVSKGRRISKSLTDTAQTIRSSKDPLKDQRLFFVAKPVPELTKASTQKKIAPDGTFEEETNYAKEHGRVFGRLGLDLIEVTDSGEAVVHARPERFEQLSSLSSQLADLGQREQARWATVDSFMVIPPDLRMDGEWVNSLRGNELADVVIELQPLLTRVEIETVLRAIANQLTKEGQESLTGTGTDFSGRQWLRGRIQEKSLRRIARDYFSVQSLHPPLYSLAAQAKSRRPAAVAVAPAHTPPKNIDSLPTVAVFDQGVPSGHLYLSSYQRGRYQAPDAAGGTGTHGSLVASRIVFGEQDFSVGLDGLQHLVGSCRFLDVNVAGGGNSIHDKSVTDAMRAVVGTNPDVRVFNFSFAAERPLFSYPQVQRRERMLTAQDLDNFIFENDVIVAVAAGNSPPGTLPQKPYPEHIDDPNWKLGHWASGYNTLVCGSCVGNLNVNGVVKAIGLPSPFTRIGPGIGEAPVPTFCAKGGNRNNQYNFEPGLGVWVCSADGKWEDHAGTSFAVPMLAREAAFAFQFLQQYCQQDTRPFAATVKAFLALTATKSYDETVATKPISTLCERTLGRGHGSAKRLSIPDTRSAVFIWQGVLESPADTAFIQCPIPRDWYMSAQNPILRVVLAADIPVNEAVHSLWGCREITLRLRTTKEAKALSSLRRVKNHRTHPLTERVFNLKRLPAEAIVDSDMWIIEVSYTEIADYHPAIDFTPQQRCAFAAELYDDDEPMNSPQTAVQALPIAGTMNRLSIQRTPIRSPIILKSRV